MAGPCCFALFIGTARALYGKFSDRVSLKKAMALCAVLCIGYYALTGDMGCSSGPGLVGVIAGAVGGELKTSILTAALFPLLMLMGLAAMSKNNSSGGK